MTEKQQTVFVIDDDSSVRAALGALLRSVGIPAQVYESTEAFLQNHDRENSGCIVLDIRMPEIDGLDFQDSLSKSGIHLPVIIITGHGDIPMSVRAMKAGAIEFLTKPFRHPDLIAAIKLGFEKDRLRRYQETAVAELRLRHGSLTAREREILSLVAAGKLNKQIAGELGLSEITVKVHRGQMMRKMGAKTLADLVLMAARLGASSTSEQNPTLI